MPKSTACAANLNRIGSESCTHIIFSNLKEKPQCLENANVALASCWLVMVLASDSEERQVRMGECGAIDVIALVLGIFKGRSDYPKVSEYATRACRNMGAHDDVAHLLVEAGYCEALIEITRTFTSVLSDLDRVRSGENLPNIITTESDSADDGQSKVIASYEVIEAAMWATLNITCQEAISTIYASVQGIDVCLETLKVLAKYARVEATTTEAATGDPDSAGLASESAAASICSVLRNLTFTSDGSTYNYSLILHSPIVEVLFDTMAAYQGSFDVNDACLWVIVNLSEEKNIAKLLIESNVADLLILTASTLSINYRKIADESVETRDERHFRTGPIAEAVIWSAKRFALISGDYATELGKKGMLDIFAAFMVEYLHRDGMIHSICDSLAALCFNLRTTENEASKPIVGNIIRLVNTGIIGHIVAALEQHKGPVASQLSEMHEPAMVLLAKTVEEAIRYTNYREKFISDDGNAEAEALDEEPTEQELTAAREVLASLKVRDSPGSIFLPIITCMKEHPTNGDIARSVCQLLLDVYYVSPEERHVLEEKKLFDPTYGKAAPGGNTVEEVMNIWGVPEIEKALVASGEGLKST